MLIMLIQQCVCKSSDTYKWNLHFPFVLSLAHWIGPRKTFIARIMIVRATDAGDARRNPDVNYPLCLSDFNQN
jgi:hypothetical protein